MKKALQFVLTGALLASMAGCSSDQSQSQGGGETAPAESGIYTPGTYEASAKGMGGDVTVSITVDDNHITKTSADAVNFSAVCF